MPRHATYTPYEDDHRLDQYIPVYAALPLHVEDKAQEERDVLMKQLQKLHEGGLDGVMVYVWWGIVEPEPEEYKWEAYKSLFRLVKRCALKLQVFFSFHRSGSNVGNIKHFPHIDLPAWIRRIGAKHPDIYYRDKAGNPHDEYLSLGVDENGVLFGDRTPIQIYADLMMSFKKEMEAFLKAGLITDIFVGLGPGGVLRYPSHSKEKGWNMPGIGEFQCYDKYMYEDFKEEAKKNNTPEWKFPVDAGDYNSLPTNAGFFASRMYATEEGKFFLRWYSRRLIEHGDRILDKANDIFKGERINLAATVSLIPWWHESESRAAELTTGYYDFEAHKAGYKQIVKLFAKHHAVLYASSIEFGDDEMPRNSQSSCEKLINEIREVALAPGVKVGAQNAKLSDNVEKFNRILTNVRLFTELKEEYKNKKLHAMTYVPMLEEMLKESDFKINDFSYLVMFVRKLHAGQDYCPDLKAYGHRMMPLQRSDAEGTVQA